MMMTHNPATEQTIKTYTSIAKEELFALLAETQTAYQSWAKTTLLDRIALLEPLYHALDSRKLMYAQMISEEMGKPVAKAQLEVEKCATVIRYYQTQCEALLAPKAIDINGAQNFIHYRPTGSLFAIMPWNFPFWQVFRFAIPNLTAGNTCLLKHAPICTGTGLAIEQLFEECNYPPNVFRSLIIDESLAETVIQHPSVTGVTLTGSEQAGRAVAAIAGQALKKTVLELGGSDACVVLADADLDLAATEIVAARMNNSGQSCISPKRIIVIESVWSRLKEKLLAACATYQCGDPALEDTVMGPLARADLRDRVHQQVCDTVSAGAKLLLGGTLPEGLGYYYPPTVLDEVPPGSPAYEEEIFGPVIALIPVADEAQALSVANASRYGLGANIFSQSLEHAHMLAAEQLEAGICAVNGIVHSNAPLPFGGIKASGFGRELSSEGLYEFLNIKTVQISAT